MKSTCPTPTHILSCLRALRHPSKYLSARQNQDLAWSSDSNLWGNQLLQKYISVRQNQGIAWSSDSNLWGNQLLQKISKCQTEPRYCMVLGLKPMGKLVTSKNIQVLDRTKVLHGPWTQTYGETSHLKKYPSARQNQGIAWSSDSNLWGNQSLKKMSKCQIEPRYCMVLGLKPVGKLVTLKYLSARQNQGIAWSSNSNLWGNQ